MTVQYLIDSENVGDFWIPLLELPADQTELIVFYTRNSPHMSYESLIKLKESDRTVTFIKCYEGTNALDFQLVSELGYRISKNESGRFVIVTNDTGFDAAVKYWRRSRKSVKRITGKECRNLERRKKEDLEEKAPVVRTRFAVRPAIEPEAEADEAASAVTVPAEEIMETRPSRPVLRDAESALQPDSEDGEYSGDSFYAEDTDLESEEAVSEVEMDLEEIESDFLAEDEFDHADEPEEDSFLDAEGLPFIESDESLSGPDFGEEEEASERFDAFEDAEYGDEPETESDPETENAEEEISDSTTEEDTVPEETFEADFEMVGKETADDTESDRSGDNIPQAAAAVTDEFFIADTTGGSDQDRQETASYVADVPAEEILKDDSYAAEKSGHVKTGKKNRDKGAAIVEDTAVQPSDSESAVTAEEEEPESAQEDSAADGSHRSRSRRSRSRRTRSGSRKQEQAESAENPAAEERKNGQIVEKQPDKAAAVASDVVSEDAEGSIMNAPELPEVPGDEEIARIVACIGADNLAELHNQLATFYGDQGKEIYLSIKNNSRPLPVLKPDIKQKFAYYCEIIFARSDYSGEYPADISEYLLNVREKLNNLNSLRYALQKHYGKEKGRRFYFLLKPFAKTMYQM